MESTKKAENLEILPISSKLTLDILLKNTAKYEDLQIFDADSIISNKHIKLAFFHAQEAFAEKINFAKSLKMEFLLRAAATKQIKVAIERCGVKDPSKIILVLWGKSIVNKNEILQILQSEEIKWEPNSEKIVSLYTLDPKREKTLENQIIEKMVEVQVGD